MTLKPFFVRVVILFATGGDLMSVHRLIIMTRPPQRDTTPIITYIENIFIALLTPIHSLPTLTYYLKNYRAVHPLGLISYRVSIYKSVPLVLCQICLNLIMLTFSLFTMPGISG